MSKHIFFTFMFCALTFGAFSTNTRAQSLDLKNIQQSVVSVTSQDKDGKILARGTGFAMGPLAEIVTSLSNLPAEAVRTQIKTFDGKTYEMMIRTAEYTELNIVRLMVSLPKGSIKPLHYSSSNPEISDRVTIVSVNTLSEAIITEGTISAIEGSASKKLFRISSASIPEGSVGSPIINMKGEVIGLVNLPKAEGQSLYGASLGLIWQLAPVDKKPKLLNRPVPIYTEQARQNNVEGRVRMRVLIGIDGLVKQVKIIEGISGDLGLNEQAVRAAFALKFDPAMKDGRPVPFWTPVYIDFKLSR